MNRRAFTLLEIVLATALASLLMLGAFGLLAAMDRAERSLSGRIDDVGELSRVHATFRRALQSIVAAPEDYNPLAAARRDAGLDPTTGRPLSPSGGLDTRIGQRRPGPDDPGEDDETTEEEEEDDGPDRFRTADEIRADRARGGDEDDEVEDVQPAPPRFDFGPVSGDPLDQDAPKRLELLLARSPVGSNEGALRPVRGAFELIPSGDGPRRRWTLLWRPIEPAGEPTVLATNMELAEWSVTDSDGQHGAFEAWEESEMPWAFRVALWMESGARVDWMFEPGVAVTTYEPL